MPSQNIPFQQYIELSKLAGLGLVGEVKRIKTNNNIDRITTDQGIFFCKTYTKGWYGPPENNGYCVLHEQGAYSTLAVNGLSTPEVVFSDTTADNPLKMPFLLLRKLEGETILQKMSYGEDIQKLLEITGQYLRKMHSIVFQYSGYVTSPSGPENPPMGGWRHRIWESDALEEQATVRWQKAAHLLGNSLHDHLISQFYELRKPLASEYKPPKMIHGDCHMDQFFFLPGKVTGVVDMEVASAGDPMADLIKFAIEATSKLSGTQWWKPFFAGYGIEPNFATFKLRLLCCDYVEFTCQNWKGTYVQIIERLNNASTWTELFS